jgi:hypothetical protein
MKIYRKWSMPNKKTFSIKPIEAMIKSQLAENRLLDRKSKIIDPFCNSRIDLADVNNDIDPSMDADYHLDAIDFLKKFEDKSISGVLFDPPYSPRQVSECYKSLEKTVNMKTTQSSFWSNLKAEIGRVVKRGGFVITCGWNSGGIGKKYGFEIKEILIVAHGGWHNDTIVTKEIKR